jgi:toxin YoeB
MRLIVFEPNAFEELAEWQKINRKICEHIFDLLEESARTPFEGRGKPELLKHNFKGFCSRRITDEHRLVYKVTDEAIIVVSCKFHYEK